jgi:hypothetical protein
MIKKIRFILNKFLFEPIFGLQICEIHFNNKIIGFGIRKKIYEKKI